MTRRKDKTTTVEWGNRECGVPDGGEVLLTIPSTGRIDLKTKRRAEGER
jgi:hypothetical protein